jgi:hypothetical protein
MKTCRVIACALVTAVVGCQPAVVTTAPPANSDKGPDIHIRGPRGGSVDVEKGGKVDVDIRRPGTGR